MIPEAGATCLFVFDARFAALDGIYRVAANTTFNGAMASGVDFVKNLYTPAGLSAADFQADFPNYKDNRVSILESVINKEVVYYLPESLFRLIPDPTIREYYPLVLAVDLGVQKNTQAVVPLIDSVKDLIQSHLGSTNPVRLITKTQNKVYLTDAQYADLEEARQEHIEEMVPLSVQIKTLQDQNTLLATKVAAYEALLIQLGTTPNP